MSQRDARNPKGSRWLDSLSCSPLHIKRSDSAGKWGFADNTIFRGTLTRSHTGTARAQGVRDLTLTIERIDYARSVNGIDVQIQFR